MRDQADDSVARGQLVLEEMHDFLIGQVEDFLIDRDVAAFAQRFGNELAVALQFVADGPDEDASAHGAYLEYDCAHIL